MNSKFLLCINEKEKTSQIVKLAAAEAEKQNAKLIILTVIDIEEIREMIYEKIIDEYKDNITKRLNNIASFIHKRFPKLKVEIIMEEGLVIDNILEFVKKNKNGLKQIFLGGSSKKGSCVYTLIPNIIGHSDAVIVIFHQDRK
jgi:K+-sensing histidine kinase KdpD